MRRALLSVLLFPLILLAIASTRGLVAGIYSNIASQPTTALTTELAANKLAVNLAPWKPAFRARLARSLILSGTDNDAIKSEFISALKWAPADPYLWQDFAQIMAAQNSFDADFEMAVLRVNVLGPASRTIQASAADLGVRHWFRGSAATQKEWLRSISFQLRHEPKPFLKSVFVSNQMYWFCSSAALELPVSKWCDFLWKDLERNGLPALRGTS